MRATLLTRSLSMKSINPSVIKAQYAVRGAIVARADEIISEIQSGKDNYNFKNVIKCNIGNPQALKQPPVSFYREVLSLCVNPLSLEKPGLEKIYNPESIERAKSYIQKIGHWTATGAYTASKGYPWVRQILCNWMQARDARAKHPHPPHAEEFFMANGASPAITIFLQLLQGSGSIMIPMPQYPLYTATMTLQGTTPVPYYLNEAKNWSMDVADLEKAYAEATVKPTALVVINPGNPTGQVMDMETMQGVIEFCCRYNICLISDEVYQENIYTPSKRFISFREALLSHDSQKVREGLQLASFHSTSKGVIGECGRRGGFMHAMNFPEDIVVQMNKLYSISLCPNVDGQVAVALMTDPPTGAAAAQFKTEYDTIMNSYKKKAQILYNVFSKIENFNVNKPEGALYIFPGITLPKKYIEHAKNRGYGEAQADGCWSMELLENKGVVVVPGSGFGQVPGTYHFRTTILPQEHDIDRCAKDIVDFNHDVMTKYQ